MALRKWETWEESIREISKGQWIFAGVLAAIAYIAWFFLYLLFYQVSTGYMIWALMVAAFFLLAVGVGLSFFLLIPAYLALGTYAVISLISFLFFGWRGVEIIAVSTFFLMSCFGYFSVGRERKILLPFLYRRLIMRGMPIFFTGLAFVFALLYNTSPIRQNGGIPQFSDRFIRTVLLPVEYAAKPFLKEFSRDNTIGDISAANPSLRGWLGKFPPDEQIKTFAQFFHIFVNSQLESILLPYQQYLPFIYLFGLFLVFRTLGAPIMWLAIGVGWVIVKVLLYFRIVRIRTREARREILVI